MKDTTKPINSNFMTQAQTKQHEEQVAIANLNIIQGAKMQAIQTALTLVQADKLGKLSVDDFLKEAKKIETYIWSEPAKTKSKILS